MKSFLKGLAAFVACCVVFVVLVAVLGGPVLGFFQDEPVIYVKTSTGEAFEAKTYDREGKEVWHSASWARAHRNECRAESTGNGYKVHSAEWVD